MKILVTGGAGYIGSHCVYELINQGYQPVIIDDLSTGNQEAIHQDAVFYHGSILDKNLLVEIIKKEHIEAVIHFAAKVIVSESVENPLLYFSNNVDGVLNVISAMKETGIRKLIFSSTAALYGTNDKKVITEKEPTNPENPYGESKLISEKIIKWCTKDIDYIIFRYFNVAGADASGKIGLASRKITHAIPLAIETALGLRDCYKIFGDDYPTPDGTCVRDYIHVTDLVRAHISAIKLLDQTKNLTINLGTGKGTSVKEIIETINEELKLSLSVEIAPKRVGDPAYVVASNELAKKVLNWQPQYNLKDIIKTDYNWRKHHPKGF